MMESMKVSFTGAKGQLLAARLDRPRGPVRATALFAHCFTCSKDLFVVGRISRALTEHGIATLRFDFTGLGHSEGDFANETFSSNLEDLLAAAAYLRSSGDGPDLGKGPILGEGPQILIGHSLGGAAVLAAAGRIEAVRAVATIGAPADPAHVAHLFAPHLEEIEAHGEATVNLMGRSFRVKKSFLDDIAAQKQTERIASLRKALLVMHSPVDTIVGIDNAAAIFTAAKHPKSFVSLDDADHLITNREDALYAADVLAAWASRWVGRQTVERPAGEPREGVVTVAESPGFKFRQLVAAGPHALIADEPKHVGGNDSGPTPYDLLLAALGACTAMTIRMYAEHKKFPLEAVRVELTHEKIHATDCDACESGSAKIDRIQRTLFLSGDLSTEQIEKIRQIADKCPVHRTLHATVRVETHLAE